MAAMVFVAKNYIDKNVERASGKITTLTYQPGDFDKIKIAGGFDVTMVYGELTSVDITVDEAFQKHIKVNATNNTLQISSANLIQNFNTKILITANHINEINLSAGVTLIGKDSLKSDNFTLKTSAGSSANITGTFGKFFCTASAGSQVTLHGTSQHSQLSASAGSMVAATSFSTDTCNANTSSGSEINISVISFLDAEASSGSSIQYSGSPVIGKQSTSSGAIIKKM